MNGKASTPATLFVLHGDSKLEIIPSLQIYMQRVTHVLFLGTFRDKNHTSTCQGGRLAVPPGPMWQEF